MRQIEIQNLLRMMTRVFEHGDFVVFGGGDWLQVNGQFMRTQEAAEHLHRRMKDGEADETVSGADEQLARRAGEEDGEVDGERVRPD